MEREGNKQEHMKKCPGCRKELPLYNKKGNHNFCPTSIGKGIIEICMDCKMIGITDRSKK